MPRRDFVLLLVNATGIHPLIESYRDPVRLRRSIPKSHLLQELPRLPFIGCLGYGDVTDALQQQRRWMLRPEQLLVDQLAEYLQFKLGQVNSPAG